MKYFSGQITINAKDKYKSENCFSFWQIFVFYIFPQFFALITFFKQTSILYPIDG